MSRDYKGVIFHRIEDTPTREAIAVIDDFLRQIGATVNRVAQNLQPDASGSVIVVPFDQSVLANYVYMPGRTADQIVNALGPGNVALTINSAPGATADILRVQNSGTNFMKMDHFGVTTFTSNSSSDNVKVIGTLRVGLDGTSGICAISGGAADLFIDCTNTSAVTRTQFLGTANYAWQFQGTARVGPRGGDSINNIMLTLAQDAGHTGDMLRILDGSSNVLARITSAGYYETQRLLLDGSTSGTITVKPPAAPTTHTLTLPGAPVAGNFLQTDGSGVTSWTAAPTSISVDKNGTLVGTRGTLNLIEGTNVTLTMADNAGAGRVDVTIASSGGGGSGTNVQHRWEANGPFKIDTSVDGTYVAPHAVTITQTRLHRRAAGSSGTTTVVLKQNGVTQDTRNVTAAAGTDAIDTSGALSVSVAAGDRLTVDATAVEAGVPLDYDFIIEAA